MAGKRATGAPDGYQTDLSLGECKDWCSNDTKCVTAMYDLNGYCLMYYNKPVLSSSTSYTVFMKMAITSTGMSKYFCRFGYV